MVDETPPEVRVKVDPPKPDVKAPDALKKQREGSHVLEHLEKTLVETAEKTLTGGDNISKIIFPNDTSGTSSPNTGGVRGQGQSTIGSSPTSSTISKPNVEQLSPQKISGPDVISAINQQTIQLMGGINSLGTGINNLNSSQLITNSTLVGINRSISDVRQGIDKNNAVLNTVADLLNQSRYQTPSGRLNLQGPVPEIIGGRGGVSAGSGGGGGNDDKKPSDLLNEIYEGGKEVVKKAIEYGAAFWTTNKVLGSAAKGAAAAEMAPVVAEGAPVGAATTVAEAAPKATPLAQGAAATSKFGFDKFGLGTGLIAATNLADLALHGRESLPWKMATSTEGASYISPDTLPETGGREGWIHDVPKHKGREKLGHRPRHHQRGWWNELFGIEEAEAATEAGDPRQLAPSAPERANPEVVRTQEVKPEIKVPPNQDVAVDAKDAKNVVIKSSNIILEDGQELVKVLKEAFKGAIAGGIAGSVLPGFGTAAGAGVGAVTGAYLGLHPNEVNKLKEGFEEKRKEFEEGRKKAEYDMSAAGIRANRKSFMDRIGQTRRANELNAGSATMGMPVDVNTPDLYTGGRMEAPQGIGGHPMIGPSGFATPQMPGGFGIPGIPGAGAGGGIRGAPGAGPAFQQFGASGGPIRVQPRQRAGTGGGLSSASETAFAKDIYNKAIAAGIPETQAQMAAMQATLESQHGTSDLARRGSNNYFGIKGKGDAGTSGAYAAYSSPEAGMQAWWSLVQRKWPGAASAKTVQEGIEAEHHGQRGGYSETPNYGERIAQTERRTKGYNTSEPSRQAENGPGPSGHQHSTLSIDGEQFPFGSGGRRGANALRYGDYPLQATAPGAYGQKVDAIGINNNRTPDERDPRGYREGILLHPGMSEDDITAGCMAFSPKDYPKLKAKVREMISKNGQAYLHWGPDGASVTSSREAAQAQRAAGVQARSGESSEQLAERIRQQSPHLSHVQCVELARRMTGDRTPVKQYRAGGVVDPSNTRPGTPIMSVRNPGDTRYAGGGTGTPGRGTDHVSIFDSPIGQGGMRTWNTHTGTDRPQQWNVPQGGRGERGAQNYRYIMVPDGKGGYKYMGGDPHLNQPTQAAKQEPAGSPTTPQGTSHTAVAPNHDEVAKRQADAAKIAASTVGLNEGPDREMLKRFFQGKADPHDAAICSRWAEAVERSAGFKGWGPIATNAVKWGKQVAIDKAGPGAVAVATRGLKPGELGGHAQIAASTPTHIGIDPKTGKDMWEGDFYSTGGGGERAGPKGLGERLPGQPGSQIIKRHETFGSDWYQFRAPTEKELLAKKDIPALPPEIAGRRQQVEAGKEFPTPPELAHAEPSPENPHYPVLGNLHMAIDQGRHTRRDPEMSRTIPAHNQPLHEMSHGRAIAHEKAKQHRPTPAAHAGAGTHHTPESSGGKHSTMPYGYDAGHFDSGLRDRFLAQYLDGNG